MPVLLIQALSRPVLPLLVAAAALSACLLGYLGMLSSILDLFAQFTAHWLVIAAIAVIASFWTRFAYVLTATGVVAACLSPLLLTNWYAAPSARAAAVMETAASDRGQLATSPASKPGANKKRFKLLTFNTYNLNLDLEAIWSEIERHDADVVILIEFGPNKQSLRRRLTEKYRYYRTCEMNWRCTIGIFSKLPAGDYRVVDHLADDGPALISARIDLGSRSVTVIGTHILSPNHGPNANYLELDHLAQRVRGIKGPLVVAGDLNTTLWANSFDNFRRTSGLTHMGHLIPTWPVKPLPLPQIGIDHIFASPELRLRDVAAGEAAGSDHLPLVATVELL